MIRKEICFLVWLAFSANALMAQQSLPSRIVNPSTGIQDQPLFRRVFNPSVSMVFDSSGKLIYFPPAVVRSRKNICFETVVPAKFIQSQLARFRDSLRVTYNLFSEDLDLTLSYYCFLRDSDKKDPVHITLETRDANGKPVIVQRTTTGDPAFAEFLQQLKFAIDKLEEYAKKEVVKAEEIENDFSSCTYFPVAAFVKNVFLNQYEVQVKNGSEDTKTIKLKAAYSSKDKCFRFTADCDQIKDLACGNCGIPDAEQLSLQLVRTDPFTETLKYWFEEQNKTLDNIPSKDAIKNTLTAIATLSAGDAQIPQLINVQLRDLKPLFLKWFWYTRGEFVVDPFLIRDEAGTKVLQASLKQYDSEMALMSQQKTFLDSVLKKVPHSLYSLPHFIMVQLYSKTISDGITDLEEKKKKAGKALNEKSHLFPQTQPKSFLNNATVMLSNAKQVQPQIQFNAARKFRSVAYTKRQAHRITELPDNEQGHVLVHNLDSTIKFKIDQVHKPFNDTEEFTQIVSEQIDKLLNPGVTGDILANVEQVFTELFPPVRSTAGMKGFGADKKLIDQFTCDQVMMTPVELRLIALGQAYVQNQLTFVYKASPFAKEQPKLPRFRTHTEMIKYTTETPFKDSISGMQTIAGETTQAFVNHVNIGKLRFVQIAFGLAITSNPISTTSIDTASGGFRVSTSDNRAKTIAGFKVYPFQNYNRDRWLLPRYPLHRLSVFSGFELLRPLDNFYFGGAYDIVPGLAFSAGKNIYLQTSRRIENNTVTETNRSYQQAKGLYYSITVNPVLFVKFTTLFFKSF